MDSRLVLYNSILFPYTSVSIPVQLKNSLLWTLYSLRDIVQLKGTCTVYVILYSLKGPVLSSQIKTLLVRYRWKKRITQSLSDRRQFFNPLGTRPLTYSEVVLEGSCHNKTWLYSWRNDIQLNFKFFLHRV